MKAAAVQKAMKAMKAMKAVKAMKAGAMKARKAMSAKKTTTEPEAIAGMRRIYAAQRTVFLEDSKCCFGQVTEMGCYMCINCRCGRVLVRCPACQFVNHPDSHV